MVRLTLQRRLAADVLKCAPEKVLFDSEKLAEIKESITKADIKVLIGSGVISVKHSPESSRGRARKILAQKKKGLRKGHGSRKGTANTRLDDREAWRNKVRKQRLLLKKLRDGEKITSATYKKLYNKSKGGYFRSERHLKLYMDEHKLFTVSK